MRTRNPVALARHVVFYSDDGSDPPGEIAAPIKRHRARNDIHFRHREPSPMRPVAAKLCRLAKAKLKAKTGGITKTEAISGKSF